MGGEGGDEERRIKRQSAVVACVSFATLGVVIFGILIWLIFRLTG
jgi:hypothetical protein